MLLDKPSPRCAAIRLTVGQALHEWEKVEQYFDLYAAVLGAVIPVGALGAYRSGSAFSNPQTMLAEAADALWHWAPNDEVERELKSIKAVASEAAARRAEIAHGIVISENGDNNHFLVPSFHSSRKRDQAHVKYAFTGGQIAALATSSIFWRPTSILDKRSATGERLRRRRSEPKQRPSSGVASAALDCRPILSS